MDSLTTQTSSVADLRNNTKLWYKINVFIYDLHNFRDKPQSQERLNSIIDISYIGLPYFTPREAHTIKSTLVDVSTPVHPGKKKVQKKAQSQPQFESQSKSEVPENKLNLERLEEVIQQTLNERLERRIKKREESGDFRVCAAHDLAPILEKALGIKAKDLQRDQEFLEIMGRCGLELGEGDEENWKSVDEGRKDLRRGGGGGGGKKRGKGRK
ncbi:hypothetical protein ONS95_000759 [Cadophora gregata]|uniref:uncharacterized protein n=1 Tax=Cadophora gregata TaxID=51156 RepID=UPI0026DA9E5E|nr:uncharacterized protein ONS95_000759 [Cadophora gregata]KAK0128809.1 hypothetical protein ONS95_000759 [Cadophora gregata]